MKCAHPGCKCTVASSGDYCSEDCRRAGDQTGPRCTCGHPDCK
jgi:hypothetical protein